MSLLDDVSIVVTPNGYKAGELYAVVPVPTEGAEEVTDGNFLLTGTQAQNITGTYWTTGTGWTISGGTANCDGSQSSNSGLIQSSVFTSGKRYKLSFNITSNGASFKFWVNGTQNIFSTSLVDGLIEYTFTASATGSAYFEATSTFTGSIDNVSVKEYTSADMDVTRETAATRVDEDGLVNYAEILGGEEIDNGDFDTDLNHWSTSSWWVWNSLGAYHPATTEHKPLYQQSCVIGKTYKITFDLNVVQGGAKISLGTSSGSTTQVFATNLGTGSYSYFITASAEYLIFNRNNTGSNNEYYVNNVSVKEAARDNVPRIDYAGGGCPHILAEPMRTNLLTYSEDFSDSSWTKQSNITPTYNTTETLSPDGTYNATKFIGNGSNGVLVQVSVTGVITRSVYLKSVASTVNVVLKDPVLTQTAKTLTLNETWQRYDLSESNQHGSLSGLWIDDIPSSGIYMWGAQLEEGSYATSYIPNFGTSAGVTRNQDIFTRDGIGSLINSEEGVLFVEMASFGTGSTTQYISITNGVSSDYGLRILYHTNGSVYFQKYVNGTRTTNLSTSSITITDFNKLAVRYNSTIVDVWANGVKILTNADTNVITSGTLNRLGLDIANGGNNMFAKVKQLQVYNTALGGSPYNATLSDARLAALTS